MQFGICFILSGVATLAVAQQKVPVNPVSLVGNTFAVAQAKLNVSGSKELLIWSSGEEGSSKRLQLEVHLVKGKVDSVMLSDAAFRVPTLASVSSSANTFLKKHGLWSSSVKLKTVKDAPFPEWGMGIDVVFVNGLKGVPKTHWAYLRSGMAGLAFAVDPRQSLTR